MKRPPMTNYRYITELKNGLHVLDDLWLADNYPSKVSLKVCKESENGIKINGLTLKPIGKTYPEYLSGK